MMAPSGCQMVANMSPGKSPDCRATGHVMSRDIVDSTVDSTVEST